MDKVKVSNRYGALIDATLGPDIFGPSLDAEVEDGGEDLLAKIIVKDRIIRIGWDGRVEVEPNGPA